jgi:REP element-mobilizing transposase RayT
MKPERKYKLREARILPGHAHLLAFSTRRRKPYLETEQICVWLSESISKALIKHDFQVIASVFMPDHVHLLIDPEGESYRIADILNQSCMQCTPQTACMINFNTLLKIR